MTNKWKKFTAGKKLNFFEKIAIYLSLGLNYECPSYRRVQKKFKT
jgi:hypothetical protein